MTADTGPTLPREIADHDLWRTHYDPHFTDFGKAVFDPRCRRCWYEKAKAEDAALLEALKGLMPLQEDTEVYREYKAEFVAAEAAIAQATGKE